MPKIPSLEAQRALARELEREKKGLEWKSQIIDVMGPKGKHPVQALCCGFLAVYPCIDADEVDYHSVSHLATTLRITRVKKLADAKRVAEYLMENISDYLVHKTLPELKEARLPEWLIPWLVQVRREGKWIDPIPFRKKELT